MDKVRKNLLGRKVVKESTPSTRVGTDIFDNRFRIDGTEKTKTVYRKDGSMARSKSSFTPDNFTAKKSVVVTKKKGTKVDPKTKVYTVKSKTTLRKKG